MTIGHAAHSLYTGCPFPSWMQWALIGYAITFIILFANFYYQTYRRKPRHPAAKAVANGSVSTATNGVGKMTDESTSGENGKKLKKGRAKRD